MLILQKYWKYIKINEIFYITEILINVNIINLTFFMNGNISNSF